MCSEVPTQTGLREVALCGDPGYLCSLRAQLPTSQWSLPIVICNPTWLPFEQICDPLGQADLPG